MSALLMRHGPKLAVGGLVALNLVLIGALVLRDPVRTAVPADPVPVSSPSPSFGTSASAFSSPTASATPSIAPNPTTTVTPSPSLSASPDEPSKKVDGPARLLAANSAKVAWRATATDCQGNAKVEVTTNGGRSWKRTDPGLTAIVRLKAYRGGSVFAIGADSKCRSTYAWVTGPKDTWQQDRGQAGTIWYRTPSDLDKVHAPDGRITKPCGEALVDLAGLGTFEAASRCADGRIRITTNGRSWKTVQSHSKVISLNADDNGFVAAGTHDACSGVVVRRFDSSGDGLRSKGTCSPRIDAQTGSTVVSVRSDLVWLWSGSQVRITKQ